MMKLLNVAREEIAYHMQYWSFYLFSLGMPLIFAAFGALPRLQTAAEQTPLSSVETVFNMEDTLTAATGYIDEGYFVTEVPPDLIAALRAYPTEEKARQALKQGHIDSYYIIAADYITSGQVTQYSLNPQLLTSSDAAMRRLLRQNLLHRLPDPKLAPRLSDPVTVITQGPPPPWLVFLPTDIDEARLASAALVVGLFTYFINASGALLIRALQREVKMRVLEILITSTSSWEFIGGKMLGLTTLALVQVTLSLGTAAWVYGYNPDGSGPAALPWGVLLQSLPYLLFGLAAYCGLVMSMAALWPNSRESSMLLWLAWLMAMAPLIGVVFMLPNLRGNLSIALSLFPPTAALLMTFRLFLVDVPWWQWAMGLVGLAAWAALTIALSIRLFRLGKLLTGQPLSLAVLRQIWT